MSVHLGDPKSFRIILVEKKSAAEQDKTCILSSVSLAPQMTPGALLSFDV
jgi:hypothetical protein